jgi:chaperone required for assembly of F1-ATPase
MRDIFAEIFESQPIDPRDSARRDARAKRRKRFYRAAGVAAQAAGGFAVTLDGKPIVTPARRALAAPTEALAARIAAEWDAQADDIDPARMPLTRLANAAIDAVADACAPVATEVEQYLSCDLLFYRAEAPKGLVARQAQAWDPVLDWARDALGARFVLVQGVMHVAQSPEAVAAAARAIPADEADLKQIWRLAALSVITTLTGSGLLALALGAGALDAETAWAAAHVDEDWQMSQWGSDDAALERRAFRQAEFKAAAAVLAATA